MWRRPRIDRPATRMAIRPFRVEVAQADIDDLRQRLRATRWPEKETVSDLTQGVPLATARELARYWADDYDFTRLATRLNAFPQFLTEIDGLDIHFIQAKSPHPNALPLIITHGWPGSIIEMLNVIGPLTDPTAYGGTAEDAFDVVVPSMPGYGYSAKPTTTGWGPVHIADAWIVLMRRLGYTRYVAQGGDWGAQITDVIGAKAPPELLGIHSNMPGTVAPDVSRALTSNVFGTGHPAPTGLTADEQRAYDRLSFLFTKGVGYALEMGNRPQTLYGLADSPVALAAWMLDHDAYSLEDIVKAFDGNPVDSLTRDEVLDNITMTWVTNTGMSSGRLYWENTLGFFDIKDVKVPGGGERVPARAVPGAAELDRGGLPRPHPLQRARPGQPLRGVAGAGALHARSSAPRSGRSAKRVIRPWSGGSRPEGYPSSMFRMAVGHSDDVDLASAMEAVFARMRRRSRGRGAEAGLLIERLGDRPPVRDRPGARPLSGHRARGLEQRGRDVLVLGFREDSVASPLFASDSIDIVVGLGRDLKADCLAAAHQAVAEATAKTRAPATAVHRAVDDRRRRGERDPRCPPDGARPRRPDPRRRCGAARSEQGRRRRQQPRVRGRRPRRRRPDHPAVRRPGGVLVRRRDRLARRRPAGDRHADIGRRRARDRRATRAGVLRAVRRRRPAAGRQPARGLRGGRARIASTCGRP